MEDQYTRWQTRRRSLPDQKKSGNGWILGKSCLTLHLTYQIYNLADEAEQQKAILRLFADMLKKKGFPAQSPGALNFDKNTAKDIFHEVFGQDFGKSSKNENK